jgi:crossover junction endodeoxyribonuclease RuvC
MRILAFDPGFERLGVAIVEKKDGKEVVVYSGCVRTLASLSFPERLRDLGQAAKGFIKKYKPDTCALEEVYFEKNAKTAMHIAEVRGMLTYIATAAGLALFQYTPLQVKIAITGYGRSDKRAVATMVAKLVDLPSQKRLDDEIDAIAVGLTCLASIRSTLR